MFPLQGAQSQSLVRELRSLQATRYNNNKNLNKEINPDRSSKQLSLDEINDAGDRETDGRKIAKYELA